MIMDTENTNDFEIEQEEEEKNKIAEKPKKRGKKKKKQLFVEQVGFTPTAAYLQRFSSSKPQPMVADDLDSIPRES